MRSLLLTFLLSLAIYTEASAQDRGQIYGKAIHSQPTLALPEGTTASLLRAKDSSVVISSLLERDGSYRFNQLADGSYLVTISALGYQQQYTRTVDITAKNPAVSLPPVTLQMQAKAMETVTVSAGKSLVENKIDRTVVNVDASVTNAGANALEVLEKSPGVVVDKEGNISLKGKEGVMVLIDGRPSQLGGADLANFLRNMNASQMDQVEIMTNPPARYDAAGNAGIINIKTKKLNTIGFNGSVSLGYTQGRYPKFNEGFNFNYRVGKVNLFTSINHNDHSNYYILAIRRNLCNNAGQLENYFDQEANTFRSGNGWNTRTGFDYLASKRTSFGIVFSQASSKGLTDSRNQTNIANAAKALESITLASVQNRSHWQNHALNLNYRTAFDSAGSELSAEGDYITFKARNSQFMTNTYFDAEGHLLRKADSLQGILPQDVSIYSGRVDYSHPFRGGSRFEAGLKTSIVRTDNRSGYDSIQYGMIIPDVKRSNHFLYEENIHAAYVNFIGSLTKKLSAQWGLRLENTIMKGHQLTTGEKFDRRYLQLFPTAYFQYKVDEKNNLGLNYGRRIRRPDYENLNPFIRFIDRYTYSQGNPDLKPQISHNVEFSHSYRNRITTTLNYGITTDILRTVIEQKGQDAYSTPANIASLRQWGLSVSANNTVTKWWTSNVYVNVFHNQFEGTVNEVDISFAATRLVITGTQQFKLTKSLTAELNAIYRSAGIEGVIRTQPVGVVAAGFSQQVFNNKGSIRLTVRDIFHSMRKRGTVNYGNVDASMREMGDTRVVLVGINFRFSKGKVSTVKKQASGSASEEQERIGVSQ